VILLTEISVDGAWSLPPKHESDSGSDPLSNPREPSRRMRTPTKASTCREAHCRRTCSSGRRPHHIESLVLPGWPTRSSTAIWLPAGPSRYSTRAGTF
jgi:hypothetical protein